jgi:putative N6-adenine-specific DNA methylase
MSDGDTMRLFAISAPGLEPLTAAELAGLGIAGTLQPGGVEWQGSLVELYGANLRLRTASRVLVRLAEFRARTFFELERHGTRVDWARFLAPGAAVRLRVSSRKSKLYHERGIAERLLAAADRAIGPLASVGTVGGKEEEDEDEQESAQLLVVRFHYDRCTISVDASGALLHRRGYRQAVARAPLRETLAASMLLGCGWDGGQALIDPMCGSGTIPIEAALLARRIAPGLATAERTPRAYAFERWPGFDATAWAGEVDRARDEIRPAAAVSIAGADRDAGAVEAACANAARAGVLDDIEFRQAPVSALEPAAASGLLLCNPPYGVRVGERAPLRNLYAALGRTARERLPGWTFAMLAAEPQLEAQVGLPFTEVFRTQNGGIPVRLVRAAIAR